jgi:4-azaleucine resistance transporter AzlC
MNRTDSIVTGLRAAAPLAVAVGCFGVTFGVLAEAAGIAPLATIVFSLTTFAGSAQFAAASVLAAGGTAGAAVVAALLLNGRYVPIGLSVASVLRGGPLRRLLAAQLAIDESWAIAHRGDGRFDGRILLGAGLAVYLAWNLGTVGGVLFGDAIGDPEALGLDAAFPAIFLALLANQLKGRRGVAAAVLGAAVAMALVPLVPAGVPLIAAAAIPLVLSLRVPRAGAAA